MNELIETIPSFLNKGIQGAADTIKGTINDVTDTVSTGSGLKTAAIAAGLGALAYKKWKEKHPS